MIHQHLTPRSRRCSSGGGDGRRAFLPRLRLTRSLSCRTLLMKTLGGGDDGHASSHLQGS